MAAAVAGWQFESLVLVGERKLLPLRLVSVYVLSMMANLVRMREVTNNLTTAPHISLTKTYLH